MATRQLFTGRTRAWMLSLLAVWISGSFPARAELTVMPLGDSITFGAKLPHAGYRYPLYLNLMKSGIGIRYVGQSPENSLPLPVDQQAHNGYPGATIEDIRNNLTGDVKSPDMVTVNYGGYWMTGGKADGKPLNPDVVILLIGTNNIIHHAQDCDAKKMQDPYKKLIEWFRKNRPNTHLILGTILPITRQPARQNEAVLEFNTWLKAQVAAWGPKCHLVDLYPLFLNPDGSINAKLLPDGVHPDQNGYNLLGDAWSKAVEELAAKGTLKKTAPAAADKSFEAATSKQSTIPVVTGAKLEPLTAAPGTAFTVSGTITAGNNRLMAPVVTFALGDGKQTPTPLAEAVTLPDLPPHQNAPFKVLCKVPQTLESGTYFLSVTAKAPEGSALLRFGPKITVGK